MKLALSLNKKATVYAISSGIPQRFMGARAIKVSPCLSQLRAYHRIEVTYDWARGQFLGHVRPNPPRAYAVDSDAFRAIVKGIRSGQTEDS
jgi:hypothetical protein